MTRTVALILALVAVVLGASDTRCSLRCYSDTIDWEGANSSSLSYSFSVIPCAPVTVVDATLTDGSDQTALPEFGCASTEDIVSVTLDSAGAHLEWRYQTTASCEEVLASLDTIPGAFIGTAHRHGDSATKEDGEPLEAAQRLCDAHCQVCADSDSFVAAGVAGAKSPCGEEGTTECQMRIQWQANTCANTLSAFEVYIGRDVIPLSSFQPDAVLGAQIRCNDGRVTVETQGVLLEYEAPSTHNADCASIMSRADPLANGVLKQAFIQLGDGELWNTTSGASIAASRVSCDALEAPTAQERVEEPVVVESIPSARLPVEVSVYCSRRNGSDCCTVYGYRNRNAGPVNAPAGTKYNRFVPSPADRGQLSSFAANTTVEAAFAVTWACPEYKRHKLRWVLDLPATKRDNWLRSADGTRDRMDCSDAEYAQWCV